MKAISLLQTRVGKLLEIRIRDGARRGETTSTVETLRKHLEVKRYLKYGGDNAIRMRVLRLLDREQEREREKEI